VDRIFDRMLGKIVDSVKRRAPDMPQFVESTMCGFGVDEDEGGVTSEVMKSVILANTQKLGGYLLNGFDLRTVQTLCSGDCRCAAQSFIGDRGGFVKSTPCARMELYSAPKYEVVELENVS
jgi:hypothetical protein